MKNAAQKKYSHHLGASGYKKAIKKWQKIEQDFMDRGIRPVTWDWPDRSKWWLFANGVTLNQTDGTLGVPRNMEEVARDLVTSIVEAKQGMFQPLLGILALRINPQAHGYHCSFHLRVFQGLSNPQGTCVHSLLF